MESRRGFLRTAAGALTVGAMAGGAGWGQSARRGPNVVLIVADDLGAMDTEPYGADLHETPNLKRLASEGVRFTEAHSASPVCSPTRASIQTGKHPARLHMTIWHEAARNPPKNRKLVPPVVEDHLPHAEVTLAEMLGARGYRTAHVGKWHLGTASHYPESQGYDTNVGGTYWGAPQTFFYPYKGNQRFGGEYRYVPGLGAGKEGDYLTDKLTDAALRVIDEAGERPFFLNLCFHTPHTPIEGKRELVERYRAKLKLVEGRQAGAAAEEGRQAGAGAQAGAMRHRNATYAAMIHSLDENVGRVLDKLKEKGLERDTVVIFTSDNGGYIGRFNGEEVTNNAPLRSGKGSVYQGGVRIPLIVRAPGVARAGAVCAEPVTTMDFFPTIAALTGAADHGQHDGVSLVPLLREPGAKLGRERLFFHYPHYYETTSPVSAVREREWKLIEYFEDNHVELYNLERDPGEQREVSAENGAVTERLRQALWEWRREVGARMPAVNAEYAGK